MISVLESAPPGQAPAGWRSACESYSPAGPPGAARGACSAQGRPPGGSTTAKRPGCFAAALGEWSGAGGKGGALARPESSRSRLRPMNQVRAPAGNPSAQNQTLVLSPLSRLSALPGSPPPHPPPGLLPPQLQAALQTQPWTNPAGSARSLRTLKCCIFISVSLKYTLPDRKAKLLPGRIIFLNSAFS